MPILTIDEKSFKKWTAIVLMASLVVLSFIILRPILLSTVFGLILAFICYPLQSKLTKLSRSRSLSAALICLSLIALIIVPMIFILPLMIQQAFNTYTFLQSEKFIIPIKEIVSSLFSSSEISNKIIISLNSFVSSLTSTVFSGFTDFILNSPTILLHLLLIIFVFFFGLRDGEKLVSYLQELSPLSKESDKRVFKQFKDITYSVIFGQIIVGIIQGIFTGIGLFIFHIPNALVLTLAASFAAIFPLLGAWLIWVPAVIYLFSIGNTPAAIGFLIYGLVVISWIDNIIRPYVVGMRTKINSGVILVSMIGGLFVFGILGLILGPLVISYLLLFLESYRRKEIPGLVEHPKTQ